jgi:hypothetical protein
MSVPSTETIQPSQGRLATPVARSVAEDLEAILSAAGPRAPVRRRISFPSRGAPAGAARSRDRHVGRLGALAAVAFLGVAAGALATRLPGFAPARAPEPAAPAAQQLQLTVAAPAPAPAAVAAEPVAVAPTPVRAERPVRPRSPRPQRAALHSETLCGADRHCSHREVLAADRRLRRAYAAAVRSGVARPVLVDYRDRWSSLRRRAPAEPARVVSGYRRMARDLERLAQAPYGVAVREERDSGRDGLRHELAGLWP